MRLKFLIALIAIITLCTPAFGQTTAREWFHSGVTLTDQHKYDEALKACDKAIELNPRYNPAWSLKGYALLMQGNMTKPFELSTNLSN